jgi:hypothetical protein
MHHSPNRDTRNSFRLVLLDRCLKCLVCWIYVQHSPYCIRLLYWSPATLRDRESNDSCTIIIHSCDFFVAVCVAYIINSKWVAMHGIIRECVAIKYYQSLIYHCSPFRPPYLLSQDTPSKTKIQIPISIPFGNTELSGFHQVLLICFLVYRAYSSTSTLEIE